MLSRDHRVTPIPDILRELAQISCQKGALHSLMIGTLGAHSFIQLPLQFRGGAGKIGLDHHEKAIGQIRQFS